MADRSLAIWFYLILAQSHQIARASPAADVHRYDRQHHWTQRRRHVTTDHMTTPYDAVPDILASGREIHRNDCEMLWADLIEGRRTWQETFKRAEALVSTANVPNPIVNWGLLSLQGLWQDGVPRDPESQTAAREAWRQSLREQDADRDGWYRRHYQDMLLRHGREFGCDRAASFGAKVVRDGLLTTADVDEVLEQLGRG